MNKRHENWLIVTAALLAGFALRCWFIIHAARIDGDMLIYGEIAKNWMQHGVYGFAVKQGVPQPTLIRLPGYPLFLMGCFRVFGADAYTAAMYVQAMIDLCACLLVAALAGRLFSRRAGLAALWLAALCPFTATYAATALTETLTLACMALAFYALERWEAGGRGFNRWLGVITASLAYAILLRPEQGMFAATILAAMLWMTLRAGPDKRIAVRAALPVLLASICVLLPLAPWTARNWRTFHVFEPLAPRYATDPGESIPYGFQRWYRTWAIDYASTEEVYWNYDVAPIEISDLPVRAFDSDDQYERTDRLLEAYNERSKATPALDAKFAALAKERIAEDPIRYYVALPFARLFNMILRPRMEMLPISLTWWKWREHPAQTTFAAGYAALNLAYLILAAVGLALWRRRRRWITTGHAALAWAMIASIALRCILLLTLDNSEPRYTLEFFPILWLLGAIVFAQASDWSRSSSRSS